MDAPALRGDVAHLMASTERKHRLRVALAAVAALFYVAAEVGWAIFLQKTVGGRNALSIWQNSSIIGAAVMTRDALIERRERRMWQADNDRWWRERKARRG
jgi:hypothetical protein